MRYAVAVGSVLLGWLARELLTPTVGPTALPFIFLFPAVTLAAFYGGFGPAIVAIVLADFMAGWSFFEPFHSLAMREPLPLFAFAISSMFIITAIQAMHVASGPPTGKIAEIESAALPKVMGVFVVMTIVVIGSVIITYWFGLRVIAARDRAAPHRNMIAEADDLLSTLRDAETGQRGFIITGDEQYLEPYKAARAHFPEKMSKFRNSKIFISPDRLNEIQRLASAKLDELERTIAARRTGGFDAALAIVRTDQGKETMDLLRDRIGRLRDEQEAELLADTKLANHATYVRTTATIATAFLNLLFLFWAYQRITVAFGQRQKALEEIQRQKKLLQVTLSSIGDCVFVTDSAGRITFMNQVAEELTGWEFAEANLKPVSKIFKIINEFSREPVENPVAKVMKHGVIVGLANHTLLIRKDGSEVPIDDSGAPIREADGTVRGVVLVFRDFSEQKETARKLKEAKETAETANKAKDQFLAMLSHELRTPLTPVLATLNLWEASEDLPDSMTGDVQMLRRSVELEARIIDDLLDLTRIARGMLSFSHEDTDVHELIRFVATMCRSEFAGKQLKVLMRLDAQLHYIRTDAARLQQILWNLIRNAAKFTESGRRISIVTSNDAGETISIAVTDTGIGMSPETLGRLFIPFEQADKIIGRRYGGLGLGLAISSALVDLMGGTIAATSEGLGKGSTFTVTFPAIKESLLARVPARTEPQRRANHGSRILLVEDHADTVHALVRLLQSRGHKVRAEETIASALQAMREETFDVMICDIGLPDGTGFELVREARKTCQTPALALTGFGTEEDIAKSKAAGFDAHLAKPVNFQKLEAAIWQLTAEREPMNA